MLREARVVSATMWALGPDAIRAGGEIDNMVAGNGVATWNCM